MKKKIEFSKVLVSWALVITSLCIIASYALSIQGLEPCAEITEAVITTNLGIVAAYEAKSFGEKNSRNKYNISLEDLEEESDEGQGAEE